jgi:hypothetical protein
MSTQRSKIIAAVVAALDAAGKPAGLSIATRTKAAMEESDAPRMMVSRAKEQVFKAFPNQPRSPLADRHLTVHLDIWVNDAEPEEALEPLFAWVTVAMQADPTFGGLAIETNEESTEWDTDESLSSDGHASVDFTIRYPTKTADQEQRQ